jgi:GT2 family glycosyltransferase
LEALPQKRVSIVIVTHNSLPALKSCLESLPDGCRGCDWDLIVVDNDSSDDSPATVRRLFPGANVVCNDSNRGFAAACNQAAALSSAEYLLFLNPDVMPDGFAVRRLIDTTETNLRVGAVGGRLRNRDSSFQPTCRRFPSASNLIFSRGSVFGAWLGRSRRYTLPDYDAVTPVPAVAGTMMLIRRSLFDRLGGFDKRYFMYLEDTDLCRRLAANGLKNLFVPFASGVHFWAEGSSAGQAIRIWHHHLSLWKYFLKFLPNGFTLVVLPLLLASNLLLALTVTLFRRSSRSYHQPLNDINVDREDRSGQHR